MKGLRHAVSPAGRTNHPTYAMEPQRLQDCIAVSATRNAIVGRQNLPPSGQVGGT